MSLFRLAPNGDPPRSLGYPGHLEPGASATADLDWARVVAVHEGEPVKDNAGNSYYTTVFVLDSGLRLYSPWQFREASIAFREWLESPVRMFP